MMSARLSARSTAKMNAEKRLVRQREKDHDYRTTWGNQAHYYKTWEKKNSRYEGWTSPRYYETNNQTIEAHKKKCEYEKNIEKRREKLRTLLAEEKRSYEIELMVKNRHAYDKATISTDALKDINIGIKIVEEDRKRHEAELSLYQHWRTNNPILREHERAITSKNLKLSWLDQQVAKRLQKEKEEEECQRIITERNMRIEEEHAREEELKRETAEKNHKLQTALEKQVQELRLKQEESDNLRREEEENTKKRAELTEIQEKQEEIRRLIVKRELALENFKQHKMKLKQNAINVRKNLEEERELIEKLSEVNLLEKMIDETKKEEIHKTMNEFLRVICDQQELERKREKHFDFIFDSEAKSIYEKQRDIWLEERNARNSLLKDVLDTVKEQIDEKVKRNKKKQRKTLEERQHMLKLVEEYNTNMNEIKLEEHRKRELWKKDIEEQIKEKKTREKEAKLKEEKQMDLELQAAKKEEERLRHEIAKLQQRCGPIRPSRSRILM